jgi:hypothetical protein
MQRSLQVVIRQMLVLCSLKIEAQWSEPMSFTFRSALRKLKNRPCGKEFNTTAFVNLLICNVNVNIILWRNLNIVFMKLFPQNDLLLLISATLNNTKIVISMLNCYCREHLIFLMLFFGTDITIGAQYATLTLSSTFSLYTNCQNRPCGKEFNTTAFVNLLIYNVNVTIILWRNLNIVFMKLFPQSEYLEGDKYWFIVWIFAMAANFSYFVQYKNRYFYVKLLLSRTLIFFLLFVALTARLVLNTHTILTERETF